MLKRADFRPSDGFMPADENLHLPPRSSTPMLGCNARCWTTIEGGKDKGHLAHGSISFLQGSPSDKSGMACWWCRRISLASSRVLAHEKIAANRQFNFNCLRIFSRISSTSIVFPSCDF